jgi:hypothetical protein
MTIVEPTNITNPGSIPPYVYGYQPYTNITPFTYRDGATFLEIFEGAILYLNGTVIPFINNNFSEFDDEFTADMNTLITQVNADIAALTKYVDDTMTAVINDSIQVQDPVMAGILANPASQSSVQLTKNINASEYLMKLAPAATGTDQSDVLTAGIAAAAAKGLWYALNGDHIISKPIVLPSGAKVNGIAGTVRQITPLQAAFTATNAARVRLSHVRAFGLQTDYTNGVGVLAATAVYLKGTTNDVIIADCGFFRWAGCGVFMIDTVSNVVVRNCVMTGAGSTYILGAAYNYSAGLVVYPGVVNWTLKDCDISGFAQGVNTGDGLSDVRITGNYIHDIPGQHGLYIEAVDGCVITNNIIRRCVLLGMKIQIGTAGATDPVGIVIANNVFDNLGSQGILLANPLIAVARQRRVIINSNTINNAAGVGIEIDYAIDVLVTNNIMESVKTGITLVSASEITIAGNRMKSVQQSGLYINNSNDVQCDNNRIINPGIAKYAPDMFGVHVLGTSADLLFNRTKITDSLANMRYGIYIEAGDSTTMSFYNNTCVGATDYGWRMTNAGLVQAFAGNNLVGSIGTYTVPPTNYAQQADTTGATLVNLEIEVNKLKAVLRNNNLIRT